MEFDHVQIAMPKGGEDLARRFFADILKLPEIPKPADLAGRGGCWFGVGDRQLHVGYDPDFKPARKAHIALRLDRLDELRVRLVVAGFPVTKGNMIDGRHRFFTDDPFGNKIEFMDKQPRI